jgi:ribosome-associated protein
VLVVSDLFINETLSIPEDHLQWSYARSSGPGGQNVNKVNSKATLRWAMPDNFLPPAPMNRFRMLAQRYITTEGEVVIQSQQFRDQAQNVDSCREKLKVLIRSALIQPKRRVATKPSKSANRRRLNDKKIQSDKKKTRQSKEF